MAVTISGTIRIDIEGLELDLQKLEDLRVKIDEKIAAIIEKISQVADADNWPHIQEGSEQLKKIYEVVRGRIEKRIERVKQEINKVIEHVKQTENKVQSRFGQLLVDFGSAIQNIGKEPVIIPAIQKISQNVKEGVSNLITRIHEGNERIKEAITDLNSTGSIKTLFTEIIKNNPISVAFRVAFGIDDQPTVTPVDPIPTPTPVDPTPIPTPVDPTPTPVDPTPDDPDDPSRHGFPLNPPNMDPFTDPYHCVCYKPILYLYPTEDNTNVEVTFEKPELLRTTYPKYNNSWNVTANTNGDLYTNDGKYYYGLYWEDDYKTNDFSKGFYVTKENAVNFLEDKLTKIGLNDRERNEFIMYWLPILERNEKSIVNFEFTEERDAFNKLNINPQPDSLLRVLMNVKKVDEEVSIPEQELRTFERNGFTAVEWGGTEQ